MFINTLFLSHFLWASLLCSIKFDETDDSIQKITGLGCLGDSVG